MKINWYCFYQNALQFYMNAINIYYCGNYNNFKIKQVCLEMLELAEDELNSIPNKYTDKINSINKLKTKIQTFKETLIQQLTEESK